MANPAHLAILKKGVKSWNEWRGNNPTVRPDLNGADLSGADLSMADLSGADLSMANLDFVVEVVPAGFRSKLVYLSGANLSFAHLSGANLSFAKLIRASFKGATLNGVNLSETVVNGANFIGADLFNTNFAGAVLYGSNLEKAAIAHTVFCRTSLERVSGLDSCHHHGPSSFDYATLTASGPLPEIFLRGCGLPDDYIEYLKTVWHDPIEFYSAFISYSSKDDALAQRLYSDLQAKGVRCWFAPEDLKIGEKFRLKINEAIRFHDKLLLLLSANSLLSDWVETEVEAALERERREKRTVLFPVRLDDVFMDAETPWAANLRQTRHIGDFTNWKDHDAYQKSFERLLRDLKKATRAAGVTG